MGRKAMGPEKGLPGCRSSLTLKPILQKGMGFFIGNMSLPKLFLPL